MSAFLLDFLNFLDSVFFAFLKFLDSIFLIFWIFWILKFLNFLDSIFFWNLCFFGFSFFLIFWFFWILTFLNFLKFELPFSRTRIFRNSPLFKINWLKVGSVLGPLRGIYIQVVPSPLLGLSFIQKSGWRVFLPSQWYVPVSTLLPVSKVLSFSPPQRSWFPNRIPGKLSHIRRISQGQVFSHSEGSRSRLPK